VATLPEPSSQDAAREFLTIGQQLLEAYRNASLELKAGEERAALSKTIHENIYHGQYGSAGGDIQSCTEAVWRNITDL